MIENTIVIIPALNEEAALPQVLKKIPVQIREVVVVNNGSTDNTEQVAISNGAHVLNEPKRGYGQACLKALDYVSSLAIAPAAIVFLDADYSDYPEELPKLLEPLEEGMDIVIGSRVLGNRTAGALLPQQRFGNWLAVWLIRLKFGVKYTDLGPFRAIRYTNLCALNMKDKNYGWTVEMQIKAAKQGLNITEVPVSYRKRIGTSKVSGTIRGTFMAGYKILWTIFTYG